MSQEAGDHALATSRLGYDLSSSLYGGNAVASAITGGVDLAQKMGQIGGPYNLNNGYTSPTGSSLASAVTLTAEDEGYSMWGQSSGSSVEKDARYDPDFVSGSTAVAVVSVLCNGLDQLNFQGPQSFNISSSLGNGILRDSANVAVARLIRRHTRLSGNLDPDQDTNARLITVWAGVGADGATSGSVGGLGMSVGIIGGLSHANNTLSWAQKDDIVAGGAAGSIVGQADWGLESEKDIPEIDIKVDSVAITAVTKKLKAKWTPELGQDLNAYHNLDAEVELTSILSEQIALEIDREILADLVQGATAGTYYWARSPGLFVKRDTGAEIGASSAAPDFTGTVSEWYETLVETINDVSAQIHRKTLRGGANFIVVSPEVANILEFTAGFRASVTHDDEKGSVGAVKVGSLTKKFDVIVDPYFLRNVVLIGRRGSSFLESGYVYAPYVPLQTTPTIFGPEDFVPRKGVMTRYAKKMVRPDMYGLVIVRGLLGEAGATS